ncbi:MAG: hypothetical protein ABSE00_10880 [Chitinispirillaceae bacterium]
MQTLKTLWDKKPLFGIMLTALRARVVTVIFAKRHGMSDDHFEVLEISSNRLDGEQPDRLNHSAHDTIHSDFITSSSSWGYPFAHKTGYYGQ